MKRITKIEQNEAGALAVSKLRVAAYCRVSTASDDQLVSLEAQKTHYESYIKANPEWEFAGIYYDRGDWNQDGGQRRIAPANFRLRKWDG